MPNRKSPCYGCEKHAEGCRAGCVEYAIWDLHEHLMHDPKRTRNEGDVFLAEQTKRRKKRWNDQHRR